MVSRIRLPVAAREAGRAHDIGTVLPRHWPVGLIYDYHTITSSIRPSAPPQQTAPLRLTLHLASPPTDKLLLSPSADACKQAFMGQMKEADFLRWGNTKRMTGLRKAEQDGLWEGIKERESDVSHCHLRPAVVSPC